MPRGVHMRCAKPGHVERKTRPNGGTVCVACQRAHDQRRLLAARWATLYRALMAHPAMAGVRGEVQR